MSMPVVAIVGRPNVGKSTLFNKLIGQRVAIVNDTPGVTRDRIYGECEWRSRKVTLVDTGGIEPYSDDVILSQMRRQAELAIDTADVIVLVTDVKTGVVATDSEVAAMLLKSGRPVVLCVNKCDRHRRACRRNFMSSIIWGWATRSRYRLSTATAPAICWTRCLSIFPRKRKRRKALRTFGWR